MYFTNFKTHEVTSCYCSVAQLCLTLCNPMDCSTPGLPVLRHLPKLAQLMFIESVMPSNHLCHPILLSLSIFPGIKVFSDEAALHIKWPKQWSFSFSISPSNEYSGLISFKIDLFVLLVVQGILKSFLQHHISKASILQHSPSYGPTLASVYYMDSLIEYLIICRKNMYLLTKKLYRL